MQINIGAIASAMQIQYPDQPISNHNVVRPVKPIVMVDQKVIWSSRLEENQYLDTVRDFKDQWTVNEAIDLEFQNDQQNVKTV